MLISYRSGDVWAPNISNAEPLARLPAHLAECINIAKCPVTDGQSGLASSKILDAAQRSIKAQGERVVL
jgi:hypothetical protein